MDVSGYAADIQPSRRLVLSGLGQPPADEDNSAEQRERGRRASTYGTRALAGISHEG